MSVNASTPRDVLVKARELIADEANWCEGTYAIDGHGVAVPSRDVSARRWCAAGAFIRVTPGGIVGREAEELLHETSLELFECGLEGVNDEQGRGHAAVLEVFDAAIKKAEATS